MSDSNLRLPVIEIDEADTNKSKRGSTSFKRSSRSLRRLSANITQDDSPSAEPDTRSTRHQRSSSLSTKDTKHDEVLTPSKIKYKDVKKRSALSIENKEAKGATGGLAEGFAHTVALAGSIVMQPAKLMYKAGAATVGKIGDGIGYMTGHGKR